MIVILSRLTELPTFKVLWKHFQCHHLLRPPEVGRVDAHLSFGFSLAQFKNMYLHIHTFKVSILINQNCKKYRCKLTNNMSLTLSSLNLDMHVRRLMSCLAFVGGMGETNKSQNVSQNNEGNENETSMHK